jgi:hypothetical protein
MPLISKGNNCIVCRFYLSLSAIFERTSFSMKFFIICFTKHWLGNALHISFGFYVSAASSYVSSHGVENSVHSSFILIFLLFYIAALIKFCDGLSDDIHIVHSGVSPRGVTCGLQFGKGQMSINGHNIFNGHIMPLL